MDCKPFFRARQSIQKIWHFWRRKLINSENTIMASQASNPDLESKYQQVAKHTWQTDLALLGFKGREVNAEVLARQWEGIVCRMGVAERREHQAAYKRCLARLQETPKMRRGESSEGPGNCLNCHLIQMGSATTWDGECRVCGRDCNRVGVSGSGIY